MWNLRREILDAVTTHGFDVRELTPSEVQRIRQKIADSFADGETGGFLWDRFSDYAWSDHESSWDWLAEYLDARPSVLFFNPEDEKTAFVFSAGKDIISVLNECTPIEFYITDPDSTQIIAFDHHKRLSACGSAIPWLLSCGGTRATD